MPEKVRRTNTSVYSARLRRAFLFVALAVLVSALGWFITTSKGDSSKGSALDELVGETKIAAVVCATAGCRTLDAQGISGREIPEPSGNVLLKIDHTGALRGGEQILDKKTLAEIFFLKDSMRNDLGISISHVRILNAEHTDFDFFTREGWYVRVSTHNNAYATLGILDSTLREISGSNALEYIDLRLPPRVYYQLR